MNDDQWHELDKRIDVLKKRMKTKQAEYETDIANLHTYFAQRDYKILLALAVMLTVVLTVFGLLTAD